MRPSICIGNYADMFDVFTLNIDCSSSKIPTITPTPLLFLLLYQIEHILHKQYIGIVTA